VFDELNKTQQLFAAAAINEKCAKNVEVAKDFFVVRLSTLRLENVFPGFSINETNTKATVAVHCRHLRQFVAIHDVREKT
jgi:hypothetical protein